MARLLAALATTALVSCGDSSKHRPPPPDAMAPDVLPEALAFPPGPPIVVDGDLAEWGPPVGPSVSFDYAGAPVTVRYLHSDLRLVFAFTNLVTPSRFGFAELLIDTRSDSGCAWDDNDWWFHAAATDCSFAGARDQFQACVPSALDWEASNASSPASDVEIAVPFAKLAIDGTVTFRVALRVTDTDDHAALWPPDADPDRPCTWAIGGVYVD